MALTKTAVLNRLTKARNIIRDERWMRGELCNLSKDGHVSVCAVGALIVADSNVKVTGYGTWSGEYNEDVVNACTSELDADVKRLHPKCGDIVTFNDSLTWGAKDKRYVLRQFDATIKRLSA